MPTNPTMATEIILRVRTLGAYSILKLNSDGELDNGVEFADDSLKVGEFSDDILIADLAVELDNAVASLTPGALDSGVNTYQWHILSQNLVGAILAQYANLPASITTCEPSIVREFLQRNVGKEILVDWVITG